MGIGELPAQVDRVGGHSLGGGEVGPRVHEVAGQARAVGEADGLTEGRLRGGYSSGRRVVGGAANYKPAVTPQNESSVPQTGSGKALPPVSRCHPPGDPPGHVVTAGFRGRAGRGRALVDGHPRVVAALSDSAVL